MSAALNYSEVLNQMVSELLQMWPNPYVIFVSLTTTKHLIWSNKNIVTFFKPKIFWFLIFPLKEPSISQSFIYHNFRQEENFNGMKRGSSSHKWKESSTWNWKLKDICLFIVSCSWTIVNPFQDERSAISKWWRLCIVTLRNATTGNPFNFWKLGYCLWVFRRLP